MKLLGIDYGTKRVGVAIADTETNMAFPKGVIRNDAKLLETLMRIYREERIEKIVLGESKNLDGKDNLIADEIRSFRVALQEKTRIEVIFEPEFYSSAQAARLQGENDMLDASAAAIILQSYLDKMKNRRS